MISVSNIEKQAKEYNNSVILTRALLDEIKQFSIIRCALCGNAILPGQGVALYCLLYKNY